MEQRRRRRLVAGLALVLALGLGLAAAAAAGVFSGPSPAQIARQRAAARAAAERRATARLLALQRRVVDQAETLLAVRPPTLPGSPAPAVGAHLFGVPKGAPHEVVGYAPYWTMSSLTPADLADVTTVCYYGLSLSTSGSLVRSGPGWAAFSGAAFSSFVDQAHAAGDRVLLTVSSQSPADIAGLLAHPGASADRLAGELVPLLAADHLDGVSVDVEGRSTAERGPFAAFLARLSAHLRAADPGTEIVLDTYPQSAASTKDFFDLEALAPSVDLFFVMGYDMQDASASGANAPLVSPSPGLSDVQAALDYEKLVPAAKVILGVPFYGYDFTTKDGKPGSPTTGTTPVAVTYASILGAGRPASWDPASLTPYTSFRRGGHEHQTWYDDPVSIALKTAVAEQEGLAGTGVWALGDEGSDVAMLEALDGGQAPVKLPILPGPSAAAVAAARAGR